MYASNGVTLVPSLLPQAPPRAPQDASHTEPDDDTADDPLRTYLREIHEVDLLTAADERELACRIEERVALLRMQALVRELLGREPSALDVCVGLCMRVSQACDVMGVLGHHFASLSRGQMLRSRAARLRLDYVPDEELIAEV